MLIKVLAPGFFARQDTRTPVRIGVVAMLLNVIFNLMLVWPLGHAGLALATSLAALVNASLLYRRLHADAVHRPRPGWNGLLLRVVLGSLVMAALLLWLHGPDAFWTQAAAAERVQRLAMLVLGGSGAYAGSVLLLGLRPSQLRRASAQAD